MTTPLQQTWRRCRTPYLIGVLAAFDTPYDLRFGLNPAIAFLTVPCADAALLDADAHPCTDPSVTALPLETYCGYLLLAAWNLAHTLVRLPLPLPHVGRGRRHPLPDLEPSVGASVDRHR